MRGYRELEAAASLGTDVSSSEEQQGPVKGRRRDTRFQRFRHRAHANPLAEPIFEFPKNPEEFDIDAYFPGRKESQEITVADIGCGYGDFLVSVAPLWPDRLMLGLELRWKAAMIAQQNILDHRTADEGAGTYNNVAVVQCNAMKLFPRFFRPGQLERAFILFPDPQFKREHIRRRVVSPWLLDEYAYYIRENGLVYIATDVHDLFLYMTECFGLHPLFIRVPDENLSDDPVFAITTERTADAQRHARKEPGMQRYKAVYRRVAHPIDKKVNI